MRALIVDDEAPARARIRHLLGATADIEIAGEASTGRDAVAAYKRLRPDLVFLDIQMPGLDGFGVVDAIAGDGAPYIVFVTADDQQAVRAFDVGAVDYLLKPFSPARFDLVLDRARARLAEQVTAAAREPAPAAPFLKRIFVTSNGRAAFLPVDRIDRVDAERNYLVLHAGAAQFRVRGTLASLGARLDPSQFLRINRSSLVRLDAIREMHEWSHGDLRVIMHDGAELMWSRRYRASAESAFGVGNP